MADDAVWNAAYRAHRETERLIRDTARRLQVEADRLVRVWD